MLQYLLTNFLKSEELCLKMQQSAVMMVTYSGLIQQKNIQHNIILIKLLMESSQLDAPVLQMWLMDSSL